jgi:hypothetical protein
VLSFYLQVVFSHLVVMLGPFRPLWRGLHLLIQVPWKDKVSFAEPSACTGRGCR